MDLSAITMPSLKEAKAAQAAKVAAARNNKARGLVIGTPVAGVVTEIVPAGQPHDMLGRQYDFPVAIVETHDGETLATSQADWQEVRVQEGSTVTGVQGDYAGWFNLKSVVE